MKKLLHNYLITLMCTMTAGCDGNTSPNLIVDNKINTMPPLLCKEKDGIRKITIITKNNNSIYLESDPDYHNFLDKKIDITEAAYKISWKGESKILGGRYNITKMDINRVTGNYTLVYTNYFPDFKDEKPGGPYTEYGVCDKIVDKKL